MLHRDPERERKSRESYRFWSRRKRGIDCPSRQKQPIYMMFPLGLRGSYLEEAVERRPISAVSLTQPVATPTSASLKISSTLTARRCIASVAQGIIPMKCEFSGISKLSLLKFVGIVPPICSSVSEITKKKYSRLF